MTVKKFTQPMVDALREPRRHSVGESLYVLIKPSGRKTWVFRFRDPADGTLRDHGLGSCDVLTLKHAREKSLDYRRSLRDGINPIDARREKVAKAKADKANRVTFGSCADQYIAMRKAEWTNAKHGQQWANTLESYCGAWWRLPVSEITSQMVEDVLKPRWTSNTETSKRVQQRIATVLDWATTKRYRDGANPARWKGHLDKLLALPSKIKQVEHRAALPHAEIAEFMRELAGKNSNSAKAIRLQILTATRPGEAMGARWSEFNLSKAVWTIPAVRMKGKKREHLVPLVPQVLALLKEIEPQPGNDFLFPGVRSGRPMWTDSALNVLKAMRPGMTNHGFRSSFRDWAAEHTMEREVAEACLAHALANKTEAAYFRSPLMNKRTALLSQWADYCIPAR